ncbi:MAG: universal stress protein [Flavobacteriaceae bacterium]|jgi:nucleotide-binding universal stress UspA family protein|nr:universal stress protein [Flavobacteriaceae bacterium]
MKKILFPTDFSDAANNAFVFALNVAQKNNAVIYVLHIYKSPIINSRIPAEIISDYNLDAELKSFEDFKEKSKAMHQFADENGFSDVELKLVLKEGYFSPNIKGFVAEEKDIDLIVMGTNGASSYLEKTFFGSNTVHTIESLDIPVLSVPAKAKISEPKSIVFATLFKEKDKEALERILKINEKFGAEIHCLHVTKNRQNIETVLAEWKEHFAGKPISFKILDYSDSVNKTILKFVEENQVNVIVAVSRNLNFFEELFSPSFTKKISYESNVPIFVFK